MSNQEVKSGTREIRPIDRISVAKISFEDVKASLAAGWKDFATRPLLSGFFGFIYALGGVFILYALMFLERVWLIIPFAVGFPLLAPFIAAGLYEMSRRMELGQKFDARQVFTVIFDQPKRELGWMAFVVLFIFWIWIYQVRLLIALFLGFRSFSSFDAFLEVVTTTSSGALFLLIGTAVGALIATALFSITVISMPMLLHREIDFISAMITSVKSVLMNPFVLLPWGAMIAVMAFVAMVPAFLGLVVVLPVLGHATWHLYRATIKDVDV